MSGLGGRNMAKRDIDLITPDEDEKQALREIEEVLNKEQDIPQYIKHSRPKLVGPNGETIELPLSIFRVLQQAVTYMMRGKAFSVVPFDQTLSTQEAADILNVSRPFVVKLLESRKIPFIKVGTHRRIQYSDLLEYKRQLYEERDRILAEIANISQEAGEY
jgi:excisionase family DNA binding protein